MSTNRYPAACTACGNTVPANAGKLRKRGRRWIVSHIACADGPAVGATTFYGANGASTIYQNARGYCEDAPCCGCCTF